MATYTKTANGRHKARVRLRGSSVSKTFNTLRAAQAWAKRTENAIDHDAAIGYAMSRLAGLTVADLITQYRERGWHGKDPTRPANLQWWADKLGHRKVLDATKAEIRDILTEYAKGNALRVSTTGKVHDTGRRRCGATANKLKSVLSAVFGWGIAELDLPSNPCKGIRKFQGGGPRKIYLTDEQLIRLLEACKASRWEMLHPLVMLAVTTGARLSELKGLRWSDIDWLRRRIKLTDTKNGESRLLTPSPLALDVLTPYRQVGNGLVFPGRRDPHKPRNFQKDWEKARREAGMPDGFVFYSLRHSTAAFLAARGATLLEIAEVLGHKSLQVTKQYAHLCVDRRQELTDAVFADVLKGGESDA